MVEEVLRDEEAEKAVLAGILKNPGVFDEIITFMRPDYFSERNKIIYKTLVGMYDQRVGSDVITLRDALKKNGFYEKVGEDYLQQISSMQPNVKNIKVHAEIVKEKALRRRLLHISDSLRLRAQLPKEGLDWIVSDAERSLFNITREIGEACKVSSMSDLLRQAFQNIADWRDSPPGLTENYESHQRRLKEVERKTRGFATGFYDLDSRLGGGIKPSELTIIGARPQMGKTSLIRNIMNHLTVLQKIPVAYFDLESAGENTIVACLCVYAEMNYAELRNKRHLLEEDFQKLLLTAGQCSDAPLYICDDSNITLNQILATTRRLKNHYDIKGIFIDHLGLVKSEEGKENVSRMLKKLAKYEDIFVVGLSQLEQEVDKREDPKPRLSDLRGAGFIEENADCVLFLYRDDYYHPDTKDKGLCEVNIAKNRWGPTGSLKLKFIKEYMRFENYSDSLQK